METKAAYAPDHSAGPLSICTTPIPRLLPFPKAARSVYVRIPTYIYTHTQVRECVGGYRLYIYIFLSLSGELHRRTAISAVSLPDLSVKIVGCPGEFFCHSLAGLSFAYIFFLFVSGAPLRFYLERKRKHLPPEAFPAVKVDSLVPVFGLF